MSGENERRDRAETALREFLRRREAGEELDFEAFCAERPARRPNTPMKLPSPP